MTASNLPTFDSLKADAFYHGTFYLKDLYTTGVRALRRQHDLLAPTKGTWEILDAYNAAENAVDPDTGKPNFDKLIWEALARLYVNAGDVTLSAIQAGVIAETEESDFQWNLFLDLDQHGYYPFLRLHRTTLRDDDATPTGFAVKQTGAIAPNELLSKTGGYSLAVHPMMARRTPGAIGYMMAQYLKEGGMLIDASWMPENTAEGFVRYHFSDGLEYFLLDFDGPMLARAMATIDSLCNRTEEEGALILDDNLKTSVADDPHPDMPC